MHHYKETTRRMLHIKYNLFSLLENLRSIPGLGGGLSCSFFSSRSCVCVQLFDFSSFLIFCHLNVSLFSSNAFVDPFGIFRLSFIKLKRATNLERLIKKTAASENVVFYVMYVCTAHNFFFKV